MPPQPEPIPFKAETRQLLNILIHSLYTEREVFLRELVSNAADALTRLNFEMLTNRSVLDPEAELHIWITCDKEARTITIRDTGIGMSEKDMVENLGTIAHSGARAFMEAARKNENRVSDIIGQFGVGFYSAFMVAVSIRVTSRSYQPDSQAAVWESSGDDTFIVQTAQKETRGTEIVVQLKDDAAEFADDSRIKEIIRKHSDYVPFPVYVGEEKELANQQTALWRQIPSKVTPEDYDGFYKQLTLDYSPPLGQVHLVIDAPVQLYAMLYYPTTTEQGILSGRRKDGIKLYASKVLIQEYCTDLLPEYLRFIQGVADSEDLPLNVSRETIHSTRVMAQLKKVLTARVLDNLKTMGSEKPEQYRLFWSKYGQYVKQGVATDADYQEQLTGLLRFRTQKKPAELISLDEYVRGMTADQKAIYYILGDDDRSIVYSPHLELFQKREIDVLLMTDPLDSFVVLRLNNYKDHELVNVSSSKLVLPEPVIHESEQKQATGQTILSEDHLSLINRIKEQLGDRVSDVRVTERLVQSPARLVDPEGAMGSEMQRVFRMLNREYQVPQKVLEINPNHPILKGLTKLQNSDNLSNVIIEQVYEDALLIEGLHPDPVGMIDRIQQLMQAAVSKKTDEISDEL